MLFPFVSRIVCFSPRKTYPKRWYFRLPWSLPPYKLSWFTLYRAVFLTRISIQVVVGRGYHKISFDSGDSRNFFNRIGGDLLHAFGENDAADVNFAALGFQPRDSKY